MRHPIGPYGYVDRRVYFRAGELTVLLSLAGADYGPQPAAGVEAEMVLHTRCIAEALASRIGASVTPADGCAGTTRDMRGPR